MEQPLNVLPRTVDEIWRSVIAAQWRNDAPGVSRRPTAPLYHVDAFADQPFEGNPAAVCVLDRVRGGGWMQRVASELNLSETAFVVPSADTFHLRWFTPQAEVALCGHATLAAAHVLWQSGRVSPDASIRFRTRSGELTARSSEGGVEIDLPARPVTNALVPTEVLRALSTVPRFMGRTTGEDAPNADYLLELEDEAAVADLRPDFQVLANVRGGVIVTAPAASVDHDFVSRYFAPWWGVDEDPVTGSAHCALVPHWAERFGKTMVVGRQISRRGGTVRGSLAQDRVLLTGGAVTASQGMLMV